ncbi:MAG TPA: hypothetical protein VM056_01945 [Terriglobales bacterium]|nr:hypothetical protein [Terriglobales bacterium]
MQAANPVELIRNNQGLAKRKAETRAFMRRYFPNTLQGKTFFWLLLLSVGLLPACGGGSKDTKPDTTVVKVTVAPTSLSLDFGQVASLNAAALNKTDTPVLSQTITWKSDNTAIAQVSPSGVVCAGAWDTAFIVCTPGTVAGTANITATAGGITSANAIVFTHRKIASVAVTSTGVACTSQTKTQQFSGKAFASDGTDITSTVGAISFVMSDVSVGTVDAAGLVTAKRPGASNVVALVNNVISVPVVYLTCAPASITLKVKDSAPAVTAFTMNPTVTQTLSADVIDVLGNPITDIALTYTSSKISVATVTSAGVVTGVNPGVAGIVASCTPPSCNPGVNTPVYSNINVATISGTSATTIYATGKTSTTIVPIDSSTNVAGTAINIPTVTINSVVTNPVVNSFVMNNSGTFGFLGTDQGLVSLAIGTNTASITTTVIGKVLAISPDDSRVIISNTATGKVYAFNTSTSAFETFDIPNASAADFSPDSLKAFIVAGSTLYIYSPSLTLRSVPWAAPANDAVVLRQGNYAYLAGGVASAISVHAVCNNTLLTSVATAQTPLLSETTTDATHVFAVDGSNMYDLSVTPATAPCPPPAPTQSLTTASYGVAFTPNQLIVLPNGSKTYLTNSTNALMVYAPGVGTSTQPLAANSVSSTTGGVTLDGKSVYVGVTGTNDVQKIDTASGVIIQIPVNLKDKANVTIAPDFVAVRQK